MWAGWRIRLSQTHKTVTTSGSGDRGQFGLIHEMGHYAFGLKDEYQDKTGNSVADAYCIDQNGKISSIMDGGTTITNKNERHEFCWSGNHRTGHTEQDQKRTIGTTDYEDTDCWTWIQAFVDHHYSTTLTLPTTDPTGVADSEMPPCLSTMTVVYEAHFVSTARVACLRQYLWPNRAPRIS